MDTAITHKVKPAIKRGKRLRDNFNSSCQEVARLHINKISAIVAHNENKKTNKERMELKKYCPTCKSHTVHKETK